VEVQEASAQAAIRDSSVKGSLLMGEEEIPNPHPSA